MDRVDQRLTRYEKGYKLAGIVYVHRISDDKFTGVSTRNFRMFKHLCGDSTLKNVILVTNMWGRVEEQVGERHEKQLIKTHFKPALDKGAQIARHFNTTQSAHEIIRRIIKNDSAPFRIQRELVDEHRQIENTLVGEAVNEELNKALARHKDEMMELREEMRKKLAEKEGQSAKEMREADRLRKQMGEMMVETAAVGARYEEERKGMKQAMQKKMQEQALQEKQKAHEEYTKQINELRAKLEGNVNTSARQREELRRISEPERQRHEQAAKEMREEADKLRKQMDEMRVERAAMAARYEEERKGTEQAMRKKMQEQTLQERQKAHEEYTKQINELKAKLEENVNTSARQREELEHQRPEQAAKEMREEADKLRKQVDKMRAEMADMAAKYEEERKGMEQAILKKMQDQALRERQRMQEQALQERQEAHENYTKQINELNAKLEGNVNTSARQREEHLRRIRELESLLPNSSSKKSGSCVII